MPIEDFDPKKDYSAPTTSNIEDFDPKKDYSAPSHPIAAGVQGFGYGVTAGNIIYPQAAISSLTTGQPFSEAVKDAQAYNQQMQQSNPGAYTGAQLAGAGTLGYMTGGNSIKGQVGRSILGQTGIQALSGGLSAYNEHSDPNAAAIGAVAGGALGAAGTAAGKALPNYMGSYENMASHDMPIGSTLYGYATRGVKNLLGIVPGAVGWGALGAAAGAATAPMTGADPAESARNSALAAIAIGKRDAIAELAGIARVGAGYLVKTYPKTTEVIGNAIQGVGNMATSMIGSGAQSKHEQQVDRLKQLSGAVTDQNAVPQNPYLQ